VRVIAGSARGRRLLAPPGRGTRPTPERVREALFSILGGGLEGERVVDLFAGTGALGIEALSRGAAGAVFVERDRPAAALLGRNLASCGFFSRARIVNGGAAAFLRGGLPPGTTLVFLDPPYRGDDGPEALAALAGGLGPGDDLLVVYEHSPRFPPAVPPRLVGIDGRRYGETSLLFLRPALPPGGSIAPGAAPGKGG